MHTFSHYILRIRHVFSRSAVVILLALAVAGLSQCRMVEDTVTGPASLQVLGHHHGKGKDCIHRCNDAYKSAKKDEERRHRNALRECREIKDPVDRRACVASEDKLHDSNLDQLVNDRRACKAGCYDEGGGQGGR